MAKAESSSRDARPMRPDRNAWWTWLIAAVACAWALAGLRQYRVDNDIADWAPEHATAGPLQSYAVIGLAPAQVDIPAVAAALRRCSSVALCIDPATVKSAGWLVGVSSRRFVVSDDGRYAGVYVFRRAEATDAELVADVRRVLEEKLIQHYALAGPAVFHVALNDISQRRLPLIMGTIVVLGGVLLRWVTGSTSSALRSVWAIVFSQVLLVGGLSRFGQVMDMSTSMVPPLMMAMGFSYAAHRACGRTTNGTLLLCLATTALAFAGFAWVDVGPIRSFAINGVLGLILVWLSVMLWVPQRVAPLSRFPAAWKNMLGFCMAIASRHRLAVLTTTGVLCLLAGLVAPRIRFATDPLTYFPSQSRVVRDFETLNSRLTGMLPFQITAADHAVTAAEIEEIVGVRKVIDVSSLADDGESVFWCLADNDALPRVAAGVKRLEHAAAGGRNSLQWRGVAAQLDAIGRVVSRIALASLPAMAIVAGGVVLAVSRSWRLAGASVLVNLIPTIALVAIAGVSRIRLDLPSLMIGAISVGVAIDDTLHIVRSWIRRHSIQRAMIACWTPCAGSSCVAAACLSLFLLSPFRPVAQFGLLMAAAIVCASLADMILLPALMPITTLSRRSNPSSSADT